VPVGHEPASIFVFAELHEKCDKQCRVLLAAALNLDGNLVIAGVLSSDPKFADVIHNDNSQQISFVFNWWNATTRCSPAASAARVEN
jgi:hypothetical protein